MTLTIRHSPRCPLDCTHACLVAGLDELKGAAAGVLQDIDTAEVVRRGRIARLRAALKAVGADIQAPKGRS